MIVFSHFRIILRFPPVFSRVQRSAPVWLILSIAAGCGQGVEGPARAAVSGNVTVAGEALQSGVIRFVPIEGTTGPVSITTIHAGHFETSQFNGPVLGTHRVEIDAGFDSDPAADASDPEEARTEYIQRFGPIPTLTIPDTYNRKSTLKVEVEADEENSFEFELAGPPA